MIGGEVTHRELDERDLSLAKFCLLIVPCSGHPWSQPLDIHRERVSEQTRDLCTSMVWDNNGK